MPFDLAISREGSKRLKKDAEAMMPDAMPERLLRSLSFISPLRKNTQAAPRLVPTRGISIPYKTFIHMISHLIRLLAAANKRVLYHIYSKKSSP